MLLSTGSLFDICYEKYKDSEIVEGNGQSTVVREVREEIFRLDSKVKSYSSIGIEKKTCKNIAKFISPDDCCRSLSLQLQ